MLRCAGTVLDCCRKVQILEVCFFSTTFFIHESTVKCQPRLLQLRSGGRAQRGSELRVEGQLDDDEQLQEEVHAYEQRESDAAQGERRRLSGQIHPQGKRQPQRFETWQPSL